MNPIRQAYLYARLADTFVPVNVFAIKSIPAAVEMPSVAAIKAALPALEYAEAHQQLMDLKAAQRAPG